MKNKIIYLIFSILVVFSLASCNKTGEDYGIKLVELDTIVRWENIDFTFNITGETEENKIADGSLKADLYLNGEKFSNTSPTKRSDGGYSVIFTSLAVDTEYELVITASINQRKVELLRKTIKTLLVGGKEEDPILISTVADFANISNPDAYYKLANDIDFLGEEIPVPFKTGLKGQFNGDNFKLKNFKVPYVNYNGIFGMMSQGTGVVKNLIIEDISYDNYENIENRKSTSLYVGLITRELGSNAKVENVTFNNINVNLYTQTYGVRFFGLVASINKGKIDGITLNNVNININFKDLLEVQIGGVIGKNFSTGKITKINYASGSFNLLVEEHTSYTQSIYQMFFGAIVGEGGGQISEIVNQANVNVKLKDVSDDQKVVVVEGEYVTVNAESLENGSTTNKFVVVNKNESVKLTFNNLHDEKIYTILINGVDRTTEVVEKSLTFDPSDEDIYVKVLYKVVDEGKKLTLTGSNYRIVSAKLGETVIYNGLGSIPSEWVYGTTIVVKGIASNGKVATIRVNGVLYEMNNDVIEFTIIKNSTIDVRSSQIKTIYIGGIAGAVLQLIMLYLWVILTLIFKKYFHMLKIIKLVESQENYTAPRLMLELSLQTLMFLVTHHQELLS